jgi:DinB family protein
MIDEQAMADHFAVSLRAIRSQIQGMTHDQSLLQLPFRGNCMNWVVGHVVLCREEVLDLLGVPRAFPAHNWARYDSDSEPIVGDEAEVIRLEKLLEMLDQQAPRLTEALLMTSAEKYASEVVVGKNRRTVARRVLFYFFHEASHMGELGVLRQLTGVNDKVI